MYREVVELKTAVGHHLFISDIVRSTSHTRTAIDEYIPCPEASVRTEQHVEASSYKLRCDGWADSRLKNSFQVELKPTSPTPKRHDMQGTNKLNTQSLNLTTTWRDLQLDAAVRVSVQASNQTYLIIQEAP